MARLVQVLTHCSCPVPERIRLGKGAVRCHQCGMLLSEERARPPADVPVNAGSIVERWRKGKRRLFVIQENGAYRRIEGLPAEKPWRP